MLKGEMTMDKDTETEQQKSIDKQKQSEKKDNPIVAVFKILLGFNYQKMGTKKDF